MLLPIHVLFISENYKREKEAEGVNASNGFARHRVLVSLINWVTTGIMYIKCILARGMDVGLVALLS